LKKAFLKIPHKTRVKNYLPFFVYFAENENQGGNQGKK